MRKKLKTSSRKPENVIKFGASQVGKIYGKAAKEQMNSLKHGLRSRRCSSHGCTVWVLDNTARSTRSTPGQQEALGWMQALRDSGQAAPHSLVAPQTKQLMVLQR